ncbi:hypothetical protein RclHR1_00400026 [Rhizophagus clarus]|uniref:Uncharacterized protein n=1 Tax=Rhizophagus clarus TaxID=94130 RepID=A0A2Z6RWK0_9GLOM|nr:hypothetical protein RclHR1_00400026 [Rhizophagus clarus]
MSYYIDSFNVLDKKKLGFSRHAVGKKHLTIETFPEHVFVYLFKDEETFKYSPSIHKYQCYFDRFSGATRLKQIFQYDHWDFRKNPITNTKGYVLLEDYENKYQVKFTWSQTILSENNREFTLGRMSCNFVADSGEFQENNENQIPTSKNEILIYPKTPIPQSNPSSLKETVKKRYRHILP